MKNFLISAFCTLFLTNVGFCQSSIDFKEYGFFHNEALATFTNKYGENQKDVSFIVDESIKLMASKYPKIFNGINGEQVKSVFAVNNTVDFNFEKIWNDNKEKFYSSNQIPRNVGGLIDKVIATKGSFEQSLQIIDEFENNNKLSESELNATIAIRSVLISSNEYWTSSRGRHRPGSATLIADFAGAGMFLFAGPVAAICGFACSYITHQSDN